MIPLREKFQVLLAFVGLAFLGFGIALAQPGARGDAAIAPAKNRGMGFWKEHGISVEAGRKVGPWIAVAGVTSLLAAYLIRER